MTQILHLVDGCKRRCEFCQGHNNGVIIEYPFPIINDTKIDWIDTNVLMNPNLTDHLIKLREYQRKGLALKINLVQGIDYRTITNIHLLFLYDLHIKPLRFAWDWEYTTIKNIYSFVKQCNKIGYRRQDLQIFMIANWKIPFSECMKKLETLKYWNIQISDCYFPQGIKKLGKGFWPLDHVKRFRQLCRKHNQLCRHNGYDPEKYRNNWLFKRDWI